MPIYEYQCQACGHELEALQKLSDAALVDCPACHQPELKKRISAVGFRLAGSGWYETDFKSGNKKNLAGDANKPSGSSGEGKGDSKGGSDKASGSDSTKAAPVESKGSKSKENKATT